MKLLNIMRRLLSLTASLCLLTAATGCLKRPPRPVAPLNAGWPARPVSARVNSVNLESRFVVLEFTSGPMPSAGTRLKLDRGDKPVSTVQITEPTRGRFATADILDGEPKVGDEVR